MGQGQARYSDTFGCAPGNKARLDRVHSGCSNCRDHDRELRYSGFKKYGRTLILEADRALELALRPSKPGTHELDVESQYLAMLLKTSASSPHVRIKQRTRRQMPILDEAHCKDGEDKFESLCFKYARGIGGTPFPNPHCPKP